ncbi:3'-5' exonuclease [Steroidobacter cummioxidans]|uniref:3'-5' exonuclease n=1 Tax=Steroidobacter cummioxidans TaxID=1803913 RepID=UPI000E316AEB|nr:3'-5' exonuclease [Steroidobacter cummioxidans]
MSEMKTYTSVTDLEDVKYLLVVDLEATCSDDDSIPHEQREIIEIGAALLESPSAVKIDEFQSYVRPLRHPKLTRFCTDLTGIGQSQVDEAQIFSDVIERFKNWLGDRKDVLFCSWGMYDRKQLERDLAYHHMTLDGLEKHLNIKQCFIDTAKLRYRPTLPEALSEIGLSFEGDLHRALVDVSNTIILLRHCLARS